MRQNTTRRDAPADPGGLLCDNTVTTNALPPGPDRPAARIRCAYPPRLDRSGRPCARLRALWSVWTVGVRISLGALNGLQKRAFLIDAAGCRLDADPRDNAVTTPRLSRGQGGRRLILSIMTLDHEAPEDGTRTAASARCSASAFTGRHEFEGRDDTCRIPR